YPLEGKHQGDGDREHGPFKRRQPEPQGERDGCSADGELDPRVALGAHDVGDARERVAERTQKHARSLRRREESRARNPESRPRSGCRDGRSLGLSLYGHRRPLAQTVPQRPADLGNALASRDRHSALDRRLFGWGDPRALDNPPANQRITRTLVVTVRLESEVNRNVERSKSRRASRHAQPDPVRGDPGDAYRAAVHRGDYGPPRQGDLSLRRL